MKQMSLNNRLLYTFLTIIVVLSVTISIITYNVFRGIIINQIAESRVDVLKQVGERTSALKSAMVYISNLFNFDREIQYLFEKPTLSDDEKIMLKAKLDEMGQKYKTAFNNIDFNFELEMYGSNNLDYSSSARVSAYNRIKTELWYRDIVKAGSEISWISRFIDIGGEKVYLLSAARMIKNLQNEHIGVILVSSEERFFSDTYKNVLNQQNSIFIVDEYGTIVSSYEVSMLGLNYFNMGRLEDLFQGKNYAIISNSEGQRLISKYTDQTSGWTIIEIVDTKQIFSVLNQTLLIIIVITLTAIMSALIFAYFTSKKTTTPLKQFKTYMERVEKGDIEVVSMVKGWKEIGEINEGFNRMICELRTLMLSIKQKEKEKHDIELDFLQAQINPHFMYNTLFSVKCLIGVGKSEQAQRMIADFIDLLRMTLGSNSIVTTLRNEIDCVKKYINIQNYRYTDRIELFTECDNDCLDMMIPRLILQPLVENAIFHGIESMEKGGLIVIQARCHDNIMSISICDDGAGMSEETKSAILEGCKDDAPKRFSKIGLANVIQRIHLNYGDPYGVDIKSEEGSGTCIILSLPILRGE